MMKTMKAHEKYTRGFFAPPSCEMRWTRKNYIEKAPIWCSVDLRDGNQSLIVPMTLDEKLAFFSFLVSVGFKEIEVGFPAASDTEYEFTRALIERDLIPDDVTIQVLTQSRAHIIEKTFAAVSGAKNVVVHLYNSTSVAQREQVFRKSKDEITEIAVSGAKLLLEHAKGAGEGVRFEYSPESFTGTEMEYALEVCNAVLDVWKPVPERPVIINLPVTVECSMPHVYANQIEYMNDNLNFRDSIIISLHPHNDRGCAVADTELALLAGGDRVEGTLFGNGERTGNVDIVTLALNMFSQGIDPELDFSDITAVTAAYEELTGMKVYERQPYGGKLVFAAFSGSHQDAIAKGMKWREEKNCKIWSVPYLPLDPKDIGREYEGDVIRINSQSGKGGIGYLLEHKFGFELPAKMREDFGYCVKGVSDRLHKELLPDEIHEIFQQTYVNIPSPVQLLDCHFTRNGMLGAVVSVKVNGEERELCGEGNGRLDAVSDALHNALGTTFSDLQYKEHALESGSKARAAAYVGITAPSGKIYWGVGIHSDIIMASVHALVSAVNRMSTENTAAV